MEFELENTGERRATMPRVEWSTLEKSDESPQNIGQELFQDRYVLSARVAASFFSNGAQLEYKERQARKNLITFLYKDALPLVDELLLIADSSEVFELAGRIKKVMVGD